MKSNARIPFCLLGIVLFLVSGCATHSGTFDSGVAITNNQFRVVGIAEGQARGTYILGVGGLLKDALVMEAKRDLYSKYPLAKGMVLANVTVDFKRTFLFVAATTLVTVSGDVIDFNPANLDFPYKGFYTDDSTFFPMSPLPIFSERLPSRMDSELNLIKKGMKVSFKINNTNIPGTVVEIDNFGIKCSYQTESGMKKIYLKAENIIITEYK